MQPRRKSRKIVLVVDDAPAVRRQVRGILQERGYRIVEASGGNEALRLFDRQRIDLALIDLEMPGMDGRALMQALQGQGIVVPIVVTTDNASMDAAVAAMRLGAVNLLNKPVDPDALTGAVAGGLAMPMREPHRPEGYQTSPSMILDEETEANEAADALVAAADATQPEHESPEDVPAPAYDPPPERTATAPPLAKPTQAVLSDVREQLRHGALNLPMVPVVVRELRRVMDDPRHRIDRLVAVVERDQELAMRVIQRANNAAYAGFAKVTNLHNAMVRLGGRSVLSVALRAMAERMCHGISQPDSVELALKLWKRTVLLASAARLIARRLNHREPEERYLIALLSEIGEPFLVRFMDDLLQERGTHASARQLRREIARYHTEIGAALLERWGIRDDAVLAARSHHDQTKLHEFVGAGEQAPARMLYTLCLARHVVNRYGTPIEDHRADPPPAPEEECLKQLGMAPDGVEWVLDEIYREHNDGAERPKADEADEDASEDEAQADGPGSDDGGEGADGVEADAPAPSGSQG